MGYGSYTAHDWDKLKTSRKIDHTSTANTLFTSNKMLDKYNPKFINRRESRDNDEHPNSLPIAIGVDVTGSMGYLSEEIVKNSLNELMKKLYASSTIPDPQLMFAAIGDAYVDQAPLQVTQYEADIRIAEQLLELWLEGNGGDSPEDYSLFWYFLANHTDIDCMKKRNKKGFAFTIGDAANHDTLTVSAIKKIFGDNVNNTLTKEEIVEQCEKNYNLFHIMIGDTRNVIPGKTIKISKSNVKFLPEIIITAICKVEKIDPKDILGDLDQTVLDIINNAFRHVTFD